MSAIRRFFNSDDENSIFRFRIDTSKIVSGGTNGSENPLTFKLPIINSIGNDFILKVDDGRSDVRVTVGTSTANSVLTFATAGIYNIEIIGRLTWMGFAHTTGYDKLKMIGVYHWGYQINFSGGFSGCTNLIIYAENTLILGIIGNNFFANIAGINSGKLDNVLFTQTTSAVQILLNVPTVFTELFNPFMPAMTNITSLYAGIDLSAVSKVEIISDSVTNVGALFGTTLKNFNGEVILSTPNNTNLTATFNYFNVMPSLAKVDIRSLTSATNFIRLAMSKANTDSTLLGWVNNFDWSGVAPVANKVTLNFKGSTHTNSTEVNDAKAFLVAKGYVFTNLTAV